MEESCGGPSRSQWAQLCHTCLSQTPALVLEGLGCWKVGGLGS